VAGKTVDSGVRMPLAAACLPTCLQQPACRVLAFIHSFVHYFVRSFIHAFMHAFMSHSCVRYVI
jgi:hypothetical protein